MNWEVSTELRTRGLSPTLGAWYYVFVIVLWSGARMFGTWLRGVVFP